MPEIDRAKRREVMRRSQALGHCICDAAKPCPCDTFLKHDRCPCAGERAQAPAAPVRLTQLVRNAGCSSKIGKAELKQLLDGLPGLDDPRVLVGSAAGDDAGVFALDRERSLVLTVDVFTPPVDDPYAFGRIAAANSASDVWAMGAEALCALSIVGFPIHDQPPAVLREILRGGQEALAEAGIPVVGGHSVNNPEPIFGYAVVGQISGNCVRNQGARPGDVLVLSKPLGGGILAFAQQMDRCPAEALSAWTGAMQQLNRAAGTAMVRHGAHAGTDITGFGLLGHLVEIARRSPVAIDLEVDALPLFPGVQDLARSEVWPGALERNREAVPAEHLDLAALSPAQVALLFCPETSGGILACIPAERVAAYRDDCARQGVETTVIGRVTGTHERGLIRAHTARAAAWSLQPPVRTEKAAVAAPVACCAQEPAPSLQLPVSSAQLPVSSAQPPAPSGLSAPAASDAFKTYMQAVTAPGALDARTKKLIALALSVAERCEPCVHINAQGAREAGADDAQISEAVALGIAFGGAPTAMFYNKLPRRPA